MSEGHFACLLVVTEPMDDRELERIARRGDVTGLDFVSLMIEETYPDEQGYTAEEFNVIGRRRLAMMILAELGLTAYGFDEYGWKDVECDDDER